MKPSVDRLAALCPGVDARLIAAHVERLSVQYFATFSLDQVAAHLRALAGVTTEHPVQVLVVLSDDGRADCTVVAFDYPGEFSLLTGVLAGLGFSIQSGEVFTYAPLLESDAGSPARRHTTVDRDGEVAAWLRRRRIVDRFVGEVSLTIPADEWKSTLQRRLDEILRLLERGGPAAVTQAKGLVNEWVAARLGTIPAATLPLLYPMEITVDNAAGPYTTLRVVSQDTPAFLYALSTALALRGLAIERVRIRTEAGRIHDEIDIVDTAGRKIEDADALDRIKLTILMTKQFTYFLSRAPDPHAALQRFETLLDDVLKLPERGRWLELLAQPRALEDLARLLGASDTLWEDFIRLQYEALLPMLTAHVGGQRPGFTRSELTGRLRERLALARTREEREQALNEFKDRELFLIDLDAIVHQGGDVRALAEPLTSLAELVVNAAAEIAQEGLRRRHGRPRTVAGLEARYALFGLGKFGGAALGYASDIELLLVYSDNGVTDGVQPLDNGEYFGLVVREIARLIRAKREGIFHVDLRLRPYGNSGPWACSLESFCRYYGPGGPAHAVERLALVRLRAVGGDPELGAQVERLRDEYVYQGRSINLAELRELRERQLAEKVKGGGYNAKFSPGALVDLEYDVQVLQVLHGHRDQRLRTPRIHEALTALSEVGVLGAEESRQLVGAYVFFRRLVNSLRMLRGSAQDLFLPPLGSLEYAHLARRMGYERGDGLEPEQRLHLDFEMQTAIVRTFIERHFGRGALPGRPEGNVVDLLLVAEPPVELRDRVLGRIGFRDPARALLNLQRLMGNEARRQVFLPLAVLACDTLRHMPDPDRALNNWERLAAELPDITEHYRTLLSQPRRLEILMGICSDSQFLADTLIRYPEFLEWVTDPRNLCAPRRRTTLRNELWAMGQAGGAAAWLDTVRRFRHREMLRIGTRDFCLRVPLEEVTADLSHLAEAVLECVLEQALTEAGAPWARAGRGLCVLAMGKLGGGELNYSSDVDIVGVCDDETGKDERSALDALMARVHQDLSRHTQAGVAYRVDLRLRPYGTAGSLVYPLAALLAYYQRAELWEIQALLKVRPVAGNLAVGERFVQAVAPLVRQRRSWKEIAASLSVMRGRMIQQTAGTGFGERDIKTGPGGLRDVEFLVQGLQLLHAAEHPELVEGNTLRALARLQELGVLPKGDATQLREDYVFLRRVEHCLQILEDRQIHAIPEDSAQLEALARRLLGPTADAAQFLRVLGECQARVQRAYAARVL